MTRYFLLLISLFLTTDSFAAYKPGDDKLIIGKTGSTANKILQFGTSTQGAVFYDTTENKLKYSNDGVNSKSIGSGSGGSSGIQLLDNGDFEAGITSKWTDSASKVTLETSSPLFESKSFVFTPTASAQYYTSNSYAVPVGLRGSPCLGAIYYNTSETTNKVKLQVLDGSGNILGENILDPSATTVPGYVPFSCPTSGTVSIRLASTGSASALNGDNAYLGNDSRLANLSQATLFGSLKYASTVSCAWSRNSSTYGNFSADTDCATPTVTGNASAPGTKIPGITFPTLPPGEYYIVATSAFRKDATNNYTAWRFSDGSAINTAGSEMYTSSDHAQPMISGRFSVTSSLSNVTIQIQSASFGGVVNAIIDINGRSADLEISVYRFPTTTEMGMRIDQMGWKVDANISGGSPSLGSGNVSSYTGIELGSLTLTNNPGNGVVPAQIPCSSTNAPTGSTCAVGNESIGVSFYSQAGDVKACVSFSHYIDVAASGLANATFQIVETPSNAQTILQEGKTRISSALNASASHNTVTPFRVCGDFTFASAGQKTLRLMYEQSVSGTVSSSSIFADAAGSNGQRDIHWEVSPVNYMSGAVPIFKGMLSSNSSSREKVERARITNSGTCAIASQSGSWLSSVSSGSTGYCTLNMTGFSAAPTCVCSVTGNAGYICDIDSTTSSAVTTSTRSGANVDANGPLNIICMGPN